MKLPTFPIFLCMIALAWPKHCLGGGDKEPHSLVADRECDEIMSDIIFGEKIPHQPVVSELQQQLQEEVPPFVSEQSESKLGNINRDAMGNLVPNADVDVDEDVGRKEGEGEGDGHEAPDAPRSPLQRQRDDLREREHVMMRLEQIDREESLKMAAKIRRIQREERAAAEKHNLAQEAARAAEALLTSQDTKAGICAENQTADNSKDTLQEDWGVLSEEQQRAMQAAVDAIARAYAQEAHFPAGTERPTPVH